jgi:YgiT-type zinc finger domain-containing protein
MRCQRCDQRDRRPVRRAKLAERDAKVALVLDVPMQECPACGERWQDWDIARRLEELLTAMLTGDVEVAIRHFDATDVPAARHR